MAEQKQNGTLNSLTDVIGQYLVPGQKLTPEALAEYYNANVREAHANYDANDWAEPEQMYGQFEFLIEHPSDATLTTSAARRIAQILPGRRIVRTSVRDALAAVC